MIYMFGINGPMYPAAANRPSKVTPVQRVQRGSTTATTADQAGVRRPPTETTLRHNAVYGGVSAYEDTGSGHVPARRPLTHVRDVMTLGALTLSPRSTVAEAWQLFMRHGISQAPVVSDAQQVIGLLLRADMAPSQLQLPPNAMQEAAALARRTVQEVMVSPVPAVSEDTDLRHVASLLLETGLPGLPVTDSVGNLAGFISRTDLLKAITSDPPLDLWS